MINKDKDTTLWGKYMKGVTFNRERNLYVDTLLNWQFFNGNQWEGFESGDIEPIVLNIIKPMVNYKVGVVNENKWGIVYKSFNTQEKEGEDKALNEKTLEVLNEMARKTFEINKLDTINGRRIGKRAGVTGEGIVYSYWDEEKKIIKTKLINNTDILWGDENTDEIEEQPYFITVQRMSVEDAQKEVKKYNKEMASYVMPDEVGLDDKDKEYGQNEVNDKVTILTEWFKDEKGNVLYNKSTKSLDFANKESLGTKRYPFSKFIWEDVIDSGRGQGVVSAQINNQKEINKTAMRIMLAIRLSAYPRLIYAKGSVSNPGGLSDIGKAIEVDDKALVGINGLIDYINPASLSSDAREFQDYLIGKTQELESSGDAATGNIDPEKASGRAILSAQRAARAPLNEQKERYKAFLEELAKDWLELWKVFAIDGLEVVIEDDNGIEQSTRVEKITQELIKKVEADVNIEVTPKTAYDKISSDMTLVEMFQAGQLNLEELVASIDNDSSLPKVELEKIVKTRKVKAAAINEMQKQTLQTQAVSNMAMDAMKAEQDMLVPEVPMGMEMGEQVQQ